MTVVEKNSPGSLKLMSQVLSQVGFTWRRNPYEVKMVWKLFILINIVLGRGKYLNTVFIKLDFNGLLPISYLAGNLNKLPPVSWMC